LAGIGNPIEIDGKPYLLTKCVHVQIFSLLTNHEKKPLSHVHENIEENHDLAKMSKSPELSTARRVGRKTVNIKRKEQELSCQS
jgi:hypothetical protein